ncbi:hypothetical protein ACFLSP_05300, partial [Bacteroidota bacterium]
GGRIAVGKVDYTIGDLGNIVIEEIEGLNPDQFYSIFIAAEDEFGSFELVSHRLYLSTLSCPTISATAGPNYPQPCVNLDADGVVDFYVNKTSAKIMEGANWSIDWGDVTADWTGVSPEANKPPGTVDDFGAVWHLAVPHTYYTHDSCWSEIQILIQNPGACATIGAFPGTFYPTLHGRDTELDGNGELLLVEDVTNIPDTIKVCAGNEHRIVLRDLSTWDCDDPVYLPGDEPQIPANASGEVNGSNRRIQFSYGLDPTGTIFDNTQNSINGIVKIGASGTAETDVSGHYSASQVIVPPSPVVNPTTISDTIVIPASCGADEIFKVYLKNWNKCNPFNGTDALNFDYISDEIVILVIASPPAPTAPDVPLCLGDDETLTVTSSPTSGGEFHWYYDGLKYNPIPHTGATYDPALGVVGIDTFYVAELQTTGNLCEGPPDTVVLTINPFPAVPTIAISRGATPMCYDGTTIRLDASGDGNTDSWQWYKNGGSMAGENTDSLIVGPAVSDDNYTVEAIGIATTLCSSTSAVQNVRIDHLPTVDAGPATASFCTSGPYNTAGSYSGAASEITWTTSGNGTFLDDKDPTTAYTAGSDDITNGTVTLTITTDDPAGPCTAVSDNIVLTVIEDLTVEAGDDATVCSDGTTVIANASISGDNSGYTWSVVPPGNGHLTGTGTLVPTFSPDIASGTASVVLSVTAVAPCLDKNDNLTITINEQPTVDAGDPGTTICSDKTYQVDATYSGDISGYSWSHNGGGNFDDPAIANPIYTPGGDDTTGVTVRLTVNITAKTSCSNENDFVDIDIEPAVKANAGGDAVLCGTDAYQVNNARAYNYSSLLWTVTSIGTVGTITGGSTTLTPTFTPNAADMGSVVELTLTASGN